MTESSGVRQPGLVCWCSSSKGEPVGASHLGQLVELVSQLRGQAGACQVPDAKVALGHVLGAGGNCAITILTR